MVPEEESKEWLKVLVYLPNKFFHLEKAPS